MIAGTRLMKNRIVALAAAFLLLFTATAVTADYRLPPSQGFGGAVFVYTR
jgi:hypothetical protein